MMSIKSIVRYILIEIPEQVKLSILMNILKSQKTRNKIVFSNFNGRGFGDNPRYIAEEIIRQNLPYDLVWLVNEKDKTMPYKIRQVKFNSMKAVYELSTARIIINNVKNGLPYIKKGKQYYIQTWHGGFPLKYIEGECEDKLSDEYILKSKADSAITDLILSSCQADSDVFMKSFWYNGEIFEKGMPRNDLLFCKNTSITSGVKKELDIDDKTKVALYAPTFRDDYSLDAYNIDLENVLKALEDKTDSKWTIVIRLHPNIKNLGGKYCYSSRIVDGSSYFDAQHLILASDLLITDYSSLVYDFFIMNKPIILYASDIEKYSKERGLKPIYFELPLKLCKNNHELLFALRNIDFQTYIEDMKKFFREQVHSFDNGHASESIVNRIKLVMNK